MCRPSAVFVRLCSDRARSVARLRPPLRRLYTILLPSSHSIGSYPFSAPSFRRLRPPVLQLCAVFCSSSPALAPFVRCSAPVFARPCAVRAPFYTRLCTPLPHSCAVLTRSLLARLPFVRHLFPVRGQSYAGSRAAFSPSAPAHALFVHQHSTWRFALDGKASSK